VFLFSLQTLWHTFNLNEPFYFDLVCIDVDMILSPRRRTLSHVSKTPILSSMEEIGQSHVISILRQVFNMDDDNQSVTEIDRSKTYRILQKVCVITYAVSDVCFVFYSLN